VPRRVKRSDSTRGILKENGRSAKSEGEALLQGKKGMEFPHSGEKRLNLKRRER